MSTLIGTRSIPNLVQITFYYNVNQIKPLDTCNTTLPSLIMSTFWQHCDPSILQHISENMFEQLHFLEFSVWSVEQMFRWNFEISRKFKKFRKHGCERSESLLYWDLTGSFREGDWNFHLSSVYRAIPLCFAFDCANYKRWLPLYYENYLALDQKKSKIHASFLKGDFVVQHFCRKRKHCAYRYSPWTGL